MNTLAKLAVAASLTAPLVCAGGTAAADPRAGCQGSSDDLAAVWNLTETASFGGGGRAKYYASCSFVALPGYGHLNLYVTDGSATASVTCTVGTAALGRGGPGFSTATFYRAGSCTLVLEGYGSGTAYAG